MDLKHQKLPQNLSTLFSATKEFVFDWYNTHNFNHVVTDFSIIVYGSLGQTIDNLDFHFFNDESDIDIQVICKTSTFLCKNEGCTQKWIKANEYGLDFYINNIKRRTELMITCRQQPFDVIEWIEMKANKIKNPWETNRNGERKANKYYAMLKRGFLYIHDDVVSYPANSTSLLQLTFPIY